MLLAFMLYPETDLPVGIERWRSYGLQPLWRPDEETVLLGSSRGSRAHVMLKDNAVEHRLGPGTVFVVDDVDAYKSRHAAMDWLKWSRAPCQWDATPSASARATSHCGSATLRTTLASIACCSPPKPAMVCCAPVEPGGRRALSNLDRCGRRETRDGPASYRRTTSGRSLTHSAWACRSGNVQRVVDRRGR